MNDTVPLVDEPRLIQPHECLTHGDGELARGISYVVRHMPAAGEPVAPSLYLCGDSGYFSGFADIGEPWWLELR